MKAESMTEQDIKISKLPKWAQEHIKRLDSERFVAVRALNEYLDDQTESPFRYWDYICLGEGEARSPTLTTRFVQTRKMEVRWAGVELTVLIRPDQKELDLQWCAMGGGIREIAMVPTSFGSVRLKAKENMR